MVLKTELRVTHLAVTVRVVNQALLKHACHLGLTALHDLIDPHIRAGRRDAWVGGLVSE